MSKYKTEFWRHFSAPARGENATLHKLHRRMGLAHQLAFRKLMQSTEGNPVGVECRCNMREAWAFVTPASPTPFSNSTWRINYFDRNGFIGHEGHSTLNKAIEAMTASYQTIDRGALARCSSTRAWALGLEKQTLRDRHAAGEISFQEMLSGINALFVAQTSGLQTVE